MTGKFADIQSLDQLCAMPEWTAETPLRVVTGWVEVLAAPDGGMVAWQEHRRTLVCVLRSEGSLLRRPGVMAPTGSQPLPLMTSVRVNARAAKVSATLFWTLQG